jgi:molybdopterin converting factor small subunit
MLTHRGGVGTFGGTVAEVVVVVPQPFRRFAGKAGEVVARGTTVRAALVSLRGDYPELARRLVDEADRPRRYLTLLLNGDAVTANPDAEVADGDRLTLIAPMAGG